MGYDRHTDTGPFATMSGVGPAVGVLVSPDHARQLAARLGPSPRIEVRPMPLALAAAIPPEALHGLAAAVVEVEPGERKSIDRLVRLAREGARDGASVPVIAAVASADMALVRTLLREGIADVIGLPLDPDELATAVLEAQARRATALQPVALAPLVCVARSSGGCGATTVATHLASALAGRDWNGKRAVLGDLDLQFGSVANYLDVARSGSIAELMAAGDRVDAFLLGSLAGETGDGLAVIGAPTQIEPLDAVNIDALLSVVEHMRRHYGLVVLDLPPGWTNWSASLAATASLILIVTEPALSSLRQARRTLELCDALGIASERVAVVANKVEHRMFRPITARDIGETLGREVLAALPDMGEALARAQDQGQLIGATQRRNPFTAAVAKLADAVATILEKGAAA